MIHEVVSEVRPPLVKQADILLLADFVPTSHGCIEEYLHTEKNYFDKRF